MIEWLLTILTNILSNWLFQHLLRILPASWAEKLKNIRARTEQIEAYYQHLQKVNNTIPVLGRGKLFPLNDLFTDVYVLDKIRAFRHYELEAIKTAGNQLHDSSDCQRLKGIDLVKQANAQRLFILGKPGAGKTTFLRYLTLQAAQNKLPHLPIFVGLKAWQDAGASELLEYIQQQLQGHGLSGEFLQGCLRTQTPLQVLVLFDGLDEVQQEGKQRSQLIAKLTAFSNEYPHCQCLITCRVAANDYSFTDKFRYIEMADFTDEQIHNFVSNWFADKAQTKARFLRAFDEEHNKGIKELANTPLLLSLLCLSFENSQQFPPRRADLYHEALETLFRRWDSSREIQRDQLYRDLSLIRKQQMLAHIAAVYFQQGEYFFAKTDVARRLQSYVSRVVAEGTEVDGEAVLKSLIEQHGLLLERAQGIYSFSHLSFQEYFTARYIVEHADEGSLQNLTEYLADDRWREVILLTVSLLDKADKFYQYSFAALEATVQTDEALIAHLQWCDDWAQQLDIKHNIGAKRVLYSFLALDLDRALDLDLDLDRALDLDHDLAHAHDLDLDLDLALDLARDLDRALNKISKLDFDKPFNLAYAEIMPTGIISAYAKNLKPDSKFANALQQLLTKIQQHRSSKNQQALQHLLSHPFLAQTDIKQWADFVEKLQVFAKAKKLIPPHLERESIEKLETYLKANILLTEALKLPAAVSDREAIKARFLAVPAAKDKK